jgi:hypothetical protein
MMHYLSLLQKSESVQYIDSITVYCRFSHININFVNAVKVGDGTYLSPLVNLRIFIPVAT